MSSQSFADLGASSAVTSALAARGATAPFPVQTLVLPDALAGRDVLVKSPTGSGKTLAFAIPLAELLESDGPRHSALVLAPTRELVSQIVEEMLPLAHARALSVAAVYGGAARECVGQDKALNGKRSRGSSRCEGSGHGTGGAEIGK